ncbi:MAG TPA: histidine kinase [Chitinophagaceae bacterium]|nr:histidine kinase [Chitinophagaceae bacterium]
MDIKLPQYSGKDNLVMLLVMPAFTVVINSTILGWQYFSSWQVFLLATTLTLIGGCLDFIFCGFVAVTLKQRFPHEQELMKRLTLMILTFLIVTGLFLYALFRGFESIDIFHYRFDESAFVWSYFSMGILNIFLTFLMEGISRYNDWKLNWQETEKLNHAYKQSQLQGLKSQVNPHFLFNSLNSLSSLIQDDEEKAEKFLDEMSKVYRYMLTNDDEQLVTLDTELKFVDAYMYLLKARYGDGLQLKIAVNAATRNKWLPPLTLQSIIENAFSLNTISKQSPLVISIASVDDQHITVTNNVQSKSVTTALDYEASLDNLVNKYKLLNNSTVVIEESPEQRTIRLPLLNHKKEEVS